VSCASDGDRLRLRPGRAWRQALPLPRACHRRLSTGCGFRPDSVEARAGDGWLCSPTLDGTRRDACPASSRKTQAALAGASCSSTVAQLPLERRQPAPLRHRRPTWPSPRWKARCTRATPITHASRRAPASARSDQRRYRPGSGQQPSSSPGCWSTAAEVQPALCRAVKTAFWTAELGEPDVYAQLDSERARLERLAGQ
jgi:hypothetical protein